jgi:hypothetical protein
MSNLVKNLLFAFGLAVILWLGYILFLKEDDDSLLSSNAQIANQAALETQEFLIRLQALRSIDIDGSLFNDQRFTSLVDFRLELADEPTGRVNPFAPVGN